MKSFRQFVNQHKFHTALREQEAAPPMGAVPPDPTSGSGETTNKFHFDALKKQFGMGDEEFEAAIEGGVIAMYQVPDFGWGFHPNPPVQATVENRGDGTYNVTFLLSQMPPNSFTLPYEDGERPTYYDGQIEDKTEVMTKEELSDAMTKPYSNMGMGGPPMGGGMDPMGGGPPAMGGPPGGII
jgi:hypothetical protein